MLAVMVHVRVKEGSEADFEAASLENAAASRQEPGVASFDLYRDRDETLCDPDDEGHLCCARRYQNANYELLRDVIESVSGTRSVEALVEFTLDEWSRDAGLADMDGPGALWLTLAAAIGWFAGGFITGFKAAAAPILHGVAIALFTFVAWFVLGLLGGVPGGAEVGATLASRSAAGALLVQAVAATAGCWVGYRYTPVRVE